MTQADNQPYVNPVPAEPRLTRNAIRCLDCLEVIESKHRHDWKSCECGAVFVDGGLVYQRIGWHSDGGHRGYENLAEYDR